MPKYISVRLSVSHIYKGIIYILSQRVILSKNELKNMELPYLLIHHRPSNKSHIVFIRQNIGENSRVIANCVAWSKFFWKHRVNRKRGSRNF